MKNLEEIDVVYIYKATNSDELKYSIRSVAENWACRKIWIVGDKPEWLSGKAGFIKAYSSNFNRYRDANNKIKLACRSKEISDPFWLFNDDFFILDKINPAEYQVYYDGTLQEKYDRLRNKFPSLKTWRYLEGFEYAQKVLRINKKENVKNFETHVPILVNKKQMAGVISVYPNSVCRRSIYMNIYHPNDGVPHDDVKRYEKNSVISRDDILVSTDAISFSGQVGDFIKDKFKKRSIYEK